MNSTTRRRVCIVLIVALGIMLAGCISLDDDTGTVYSTTPAPYHYSERSVEVRIMDGEDLGELATAEPFERRKQ